MPRGHYNRKAKPEAPAANGHAFPVRVRLRLQYGFIAKFGAVYLKAEGTVIDDPEEIAMLIERGAPIDAV